MAWVLSPAKRRNRSPLSCSSHILKPERIFVMSGFEKQTYTQVPNSLFEIMSEMDECELKVVLYICRYTFGYHREEIKISTRKLAEAIGMNTASVAKGAEAAVARGLIEKITDGQNTTVWRALVSDSENESPVIQKMNRSDSENESQSGVKETINKKNKELSTEKIQEIVISANKAVDGILASGIPPEGYFKGRELIAENHLHYADWYHKTTNQVLTKRSQRSWWKAFREWQDEGLSIEHLQTAYGVEVAWRKFITDPNQITSKAVAIKAAGTKNKPVQPAKTDDNDAPMSY